MSDAPLARLIECYVLLAIGKLSDDQQKALHSIAPKLCRIYNRTGTWDQIIAAELEFPANLPERLRQLWKQAKGVSPEEFARRFVSANFGQDSGS